MHVQQQYFSRICEVMQFERYHKFVFVALDISCVSFRGAHRSEAASEGPMCHSGAMQPTATHFKGCSLQFLNIFYLNVIFFFLHVLI